MSSGEHYEASSCQINREVIADQLYYCDDDFIDKDDDVNDHDIDSFYLAFLRLTINST